MIVNQAMRPIAERFGKKYPFIKLTYWRADSEDIVQKSSAEVRAGNVVGDVIEGTGAGEQAVAANIVQPYATPVLAAFPEMYRDPNSLWTPTRLSYFSIAYNTRLVPANKVPNPTGVFAGLDKITGRITSFDVSIGETVQFGALQVTPRACYTRPPTETPHTDAFIEVDEVTLQGEIRCFLLAQGFVQFADFLALVEFGFGDGTHELFECGCPAVLDQPRINMHAAQIPH